MRETGHPLNERFSANISGLGPVRAKRVIRGCQEGGFTKTIGLSRDNGTPLSQEEIDQNLEAIHRQFGFLNR